MDNTNELDLTKSLNNIDYSIFNSYKPSEFSLTFINFIKLVNDGHGEENLSPVYHYHMLDQLVKFRYNLYVAFRGSGKSTIFGEYMLLYLALFNSLPLIPSITAALYISDTMDNGVKSMRKNLESRYERSKFLKKYIPTVEFTDNRWEFTNKSGLKFIARGYGAATGIRGVREEGIRPSLCHKKGTVIMTDEGIHLVEKYSYKGETKKEKGIKVYLYGFQYPEIVTKEHRYKEKTNNWIEACNLIPFKTILFKPIDMTIQPIPTVKIHSVNKLKTITINTYLEKNEFWFLYGYWLACGEVESKINIKFNNNVRLDILYLIDSLSLPTKMVKDGYIVNMKNQKWQTKAKGLWSSKIIPEWVMKLDLVRQNEIIKGFNFGNPKLYSKNINLLHLIGMLYERQGKLYNISNNSLQIIDYNNDLLYRENDVVYRIVEKIENTEKEEQFVPIQTPTHDYKTFFGISHNCIIDDILSDKNADSPTIIDDINNTIYSAATYALHPQHSMIWIGTPFNKKDPLYSSFGTKMWNSNAYPICEKFPCDKSEFRGAWSDRFDYDFIKQNYDNMLSVGKINSFNKELMLKIMSDDDKLLLDDEIIFEDNLDYIYNTNKYSYYITTDLAVSEKQTSDYRVILVWCYTHNKDFILIDGSIDRCKINVFIDKLFLFASKYKPANTVIEKSATQKGFIDIIEKEMINRQQYFYIGRNKRSKEAGYDMNSSKLARFNAVLPLFKLKKIKFHNAVKKSIIDKEGFDELTSITDSGIKSKHDDFIDAVSQLALIIPYIEELQKEEIPTIIEKTVDKQIFYPYNSELEVTSDDDILGDYL